MLFIVDDGTMDTVVGCGSCDWQGRYNPEEIVGGYTDGDVSERGLEMRRVQTALEMAGEDHECGEAE